MIEVAWWALSLGVLVYGLIIYWWAYSRGRYQTFENWHIEVGPGKIVVKRMCNRPGEYSSARYEEVKSFAFDPIDPESRAEALSQAEEVLDGMRLLSRQAIEMRHR